MKKTTFFIVLTLLTMFASCMDDAVEYDPDKTYKDTRGKHPTAYKSTSGNLSEINTAFINETAWETGQTIRIKFLNGTLIAQNKVMEVSAQWLDFANQKFEYVDGSQDADVKIAFNWKGEQVPCSTIGTDCRNVPQDEPSMNLMLFNDNNEDEINGVDFEGQILREFGHVLGLLYENQAP